MDGGFDYRLLAGMMTQLRTTGAAWTGRHVVLLVLSPLIVLIGYMALALLLD